MREELWGETNDHPISTKCEREQRVKLRPYLDMMKTVSLVVSDNARPTEHFETFTFLATVGRGLRFRMLRQMATWTFRVCVAHTALPSNLLRQVHLPVFEP